MRITRNKADTRKVVYIKENPVYLMTVKQVAERLAIPVTATNKIYKLLNNGYLNYLDFNGKKVVSSDLESFISKLKIDKNFASEVNQIIRGKEVV